MSRRRPTPVQIDVLSRLQDGQDITNPLPDQLHRIVLSFGWTQNGDHIIAHRTLATDDPLVGRTELFRITLQGVVTQH